MQVEGQHDDSLLLLMATGARVRNAYPTFPRVRDSPAKVGLIPYALPRGHPMGRKGFGRMEMGMRRISLTAG